MRVSPGGRWSTSTAARVCALVLPLVLLVTAAGAATGPSSEQPLPAGDVVRLVDGASVPALGAVAPSAQVEGDVVSAFEEDERVPVIVRLREQVDLPAVAAQARTAGRSRGRADRVRAVVDALRQKADQTQPGVRGLLRDEESAGRARDVRSFWIFNGLSANVSRATLDRLAEHPAVESIELDEELTLPETTSAPRLPTWGLEKVNATKTWGEYGFTGKGVVIGTMDSGVDGGHPALASRYRGRNGDTASSWYAATGENYPEPADGHGHGTHVMGSILGGPPGEVVGVAPEAEWIAVKIFRDSGSTSTSIIHDGFQWMLAPGGDPAKAPRVVNNSWGSTATLSTEFLADVRAWVAAGIFPAFANGNNGPGTGTVGSPGSFPESFGVGATDVNDQIASFSSRGPVVWDGVTYVKPQVSAPGHQIFSSWPRQLPQGAYYTISGTSMATPHLTGVVALLLSAKPDLSVDAIRELLTSTARDEPHMGKLPNNDYGSGIVDAYAAITAARFSGTLRGVVRGPDGPVAARVAVPELGVETTSDAATGLYELTLREGTWTVEVSAYGFIPAAAEVSSAAGVEVVRDFTLETAAVHTLSGNVTAGGQPVPGARIQVEGTPLEPAYTGADGAYSLDIAAGAYTVSADATGHERATLQLTVDGDETADFALEPLAGQIEPGWAEYQNNEARTGLSAEQLSAGALTESWAIDLPEQIMFASPVIAGGRIYLAGDAGRLTALDLDDGGVEWTFQTGAALRSTPAVAGGRVYLGGGDSGVFHALDAATGAPVWSYPTGDRLTYAAPTVEDGTVYFGTGWGSGNGGWVYALDAASGALRWKAFVGAEIYFAPAVGGGRVYAASYDAQRLVALDAATGSEVWSLSRTTDSFAAMPAYADGRLYVATNNFDTGAGSILAVDAETGELLWEATGHGDAAGNTPVPFADLVVAGSSTNNWVVAYDRDTGERRWVHPVGAAVSNSQLVADGVLVGGSQQDHRAWALDAYTGEQLWDDTLADNVLSAPALADGRLVVADRSGGVHAYEAPGVVAGTVESEAGAPLDAEVRVVGQDEAVTTDPATGAFELPLRPGTYTVEARAYGYGAEQAEVTIRSGQTAARDFTLAAAGTGSLRGVARDEHGDPLAGVRIELVGTPVSPATTGDDGAFAFADVAAGAYTLAATKGGYVRSESDVTVATGEETVAAVTLLRYQIAVTGDRNAAITNRLESRGFRVESTTAAAIVDRPGDYELIVANGSQDDPGDAAIRRLVENADAAEVSVLFLDTWGISYGSLLHLSRATGDPAQTKSGYNDGEVSLIARVTHPLTEGLTLGTRVEALAPQTEWASFSGYSGRSVADVYLGDQGGVVGSGIGYQARTFGSVHVLLSLHAASPWSGPTLSWTPAGATVFDNAVSYALDASFGSVEGTITDSGGNPVAAKVTVIETGETATAGADGGYRLLLPAGEHTLRVERIGYTTQEHVVEVVEREATTLDVQLASSGAGGITGVVTSTAGGPVAGALVEVLDSGLEPATTGADGRFSVDGVPGGTYRLQVSATGFRTHVVEGVVVVDGAATDVAVELRPSVRAAVIGDASGLKDFLVANDVAAAATGWEAIANLASYDLVIVNQPTDPGKAAFLAHLAALDAAGKSAVFLEGNFSTSGGARLLRLHTGNPATNAQVGTTTGNRYLRPPAGGHPLFAGVALTNGIVEILAPGRRTGYSNGYSGVPLAQFGANNVDLGLGAGYEPRTPSSVRLLLGPLGSHSSASPSNGWTDAGKRIFLNAVDWAASPGLGAVAGRVVDAGGAPIGFAHLELLESGQETTTAADGSYLIPHAPGDYTLEVEAFGYAARQIPVRIDAGQTTQVDVELALAAVGSVTGVVTSRPDVSPTAGEGEPLAGAEVVLVGYPRNTVTGEDGSYTLANLEPGTYSIEVRADGYVRQRVDGVVVAAGAATARDVALRPSPSVGVIDDCQQNSGCTNKLQAYLNEWGYVAEEIGWDDHERLAELDLVVANLGDFPRLDPGEAGLAAFQDAANRAHVPVIWLEQFQRGSIRHLSRYEGDPVSVGEGRSQGTVEAEIVADHPLVAGFAVGQRVPIVDSGGEHTWFNGFSGTTVANLRTGTGGVKGSSIAYRGRTASSVDVLFSSFAASFYTWPPVGGQPAELLTPQAEKLFHNALAWALDAPPLAAEARGTVRSSAGGTLPSTVKLVETGKSYPGRAGDGTFLVPLRPGSWTLEVSAFGHATTSVPVTVAAGDVRQLEVVLQADDTGAVAGRVVDEGGTPLDGVSLALEDTPLAATTTVDGRYRIENVPAAGYTLVVRKTGFGLQRIPVTVSPGETATVDVTMAVSRAVAVAGDHSDGITTLLTENGYAVSQWSWADIQSHVGDLDEVELVVLNGAGSSPTSAEFTAFVDAAKAAGVPLILAGQFGNGSIRVSRTALGDPTTVTQNFTQGGIYYRPAVEHPIFAGFPVGEPIELMRHPSGGTSNQQYEFFDGYSGTTIAAFGAAAKGGDLGDGVAYRFVTPTTVHVLLDSLGAAIYGYPGERWSENAERIYLNAVAWALDAAQGEVHGTVTSGGAAVSGATVTAVEAGASTRTAADGTYRLGVPDGTHTIRIAATGYEPFETTVMVGENERVRLDAELVAVPRGGISGSVVDAASGDPIADASVALAGVQAAEISTDATGAFSFASLLPGDYTVTISAAGYLPRELPATVAAGETTQLAVELTANDVAVLGDPDGTLVDFLRDHDVAAEALGWSDAAAVPRFAVLVVNGGDPTAPEFDAVVGSADEAGVSLVFTGTWGVANGGIRLLERFRPDEVAVGGQGYRDGAVSLTGFDGAHPLFAGLSDGVQPIAPDGYWSVLEQYVGPYLADLLVEERGALGPAAAYDFRSGDSVHLLLSTGAVTGLIGPGYGWTDDGERLFLNAIEWSRDVEQAAPLAPELRTDADPVVTRSPVTLTGRAEFRAAVRILRDGAQVATAEPARDGAFSVGADLNEGPNSFTAVAANYAGDSPPSSPVTIVLDTTGPVLTWAPADHDGFFAPSVRVHGTVTDPHAGVDALALNGVPMTVGTDGSFSAEIALAEGSNTLTLTARDRVGNETTESRTVSSFRYTTAWQVAGQRGGTVQAFLRISDASGRSLEVDSAVAQLVTGADEIAAERSLRWDRKDARYHANFGRQPTGAYRLRALLVVEGWNVLVDGPEIGVGPSTTAEVPAGAATG